MTARVIPASMKRPAYMTAMRPETSAAVMGDEDDRHARSSLQLAHRTVTPFTGTWFAQDGQRFANVERRRCCGG
jgi:hypothetical protein